MSSITSAGAALPVPVQTDEREPLREAAEKLEAAFLAEMLRASDFGETPSAFGGGPGEDQFTSFLRSATAEAMVEAGGVGLAEHFFNTLAGGANLEP
ncbi:MAG: rod-binding protein [Paracoccaceae bacterium]|nr:rod-binding protein [Paracoccaceae bacterium]